MPPSLLTLHKKFTRVRFTLFIAYSDSNHPDFVGIIPILLENPEYFRQILIVRISFGDPFKMAPVVTSGRNEQDKLDWLPFKSVILDLSNFVWINMSQSKELGYFVFHYSSSIKK